jgi:putative tricarboxylic transport membrane protein
MVLGIPTNAVIAILMGALLIHGIRPGPGLMTKHLDIFWGFVGSMYIGNAMLLILNLPLIPLWVQILKVPYRILFPLIVLFIITGAYSVNNSMFDVALSIVFGGFGYVLRRLKFEAAPLIMAFILGPAIDESLRQSLIVSQGSFDIFVSRPFSLAFLVLGVAIILYSLVPVFRRR